MKRLLLPLIAALGLPISVSAESVWLILFPYRAALEKIEMTDMAQCEEMGRKFTIGINIYKENSIKFAYVCLEGK